MKKLLLMAIYISLFSGCSLINTISLKQAKVIDCHYFQLPAQHQFNQCWVRIEERRKPESIGVHIETKTPSHAIIKHKQTGKYAIINKAGELQTAYYDKISANYANPIIDVQMGEKREKLDWNYQIISK